MYFLRQKQEKNAAFWVPKCLQPVDPDAVLVPPGVVRFVERKEERIRGGFAGDGGRMAVTREDIGIPGKDHELVHQGFP